VRAEYLQDGETEGHERNQRQQGRVDEAHGTQVDLAVPQITNHGIGVAERADRKPEQPRPGRGGPEEAPVEKSPDA